MFPAIKIWSTSNNRTRIVRFLSQKCVLDLRTHEITTPKFFECHEVKEITYVGSDNDIYWAEPNHEELMSVTLPEFYTTNPGFMKLLEMANFPIDEHSIKRLKEQESDLLSNRTELNKELKKVREELNLINKSPRNKNLERTSTLELD